MHRLRLPHGVARVDRLHGSLFGRRAVSQLALAILEVGDSLDSWFGDVPGITRTSVNLRPTESAFVMCDEAIDFGILKGS